jgi:hypothetical protein
LPFFFLHFFSYARFVHDVGDVAVITVIELARVM